MKKALMLLWVLAMLFGLTACGRTQTETELIVFAAASLQETLTELGDIYMAEHPGVTVLFNFDSSGTLRTQILEGADCDVFISAGQSQMDDLGELAQNRFNLLENKVALAVPNGNPAEIESFEALRKALTDGTVLLAVGNADVPVGQYSQRLLEGFDLTEKELTDKGCLTYGSNAREVTTQVAEGMVDCGIIYATDAFSAGLTVVDTATAEMCGQVIYPAAMIKTSQNPEEAAEAFLGFLRSGIADDIFAQVGFTPIE